VKETNSGWSIKRQGRSVTSEAMLHRQQEHPKHRLVGRAPAGHLQGGRPAFRRRLGGGSGFAAARSCPSWWSMLPKAPPPGDWQISDAACGGRATRSQPGGKPSTSSRCQTTSLTTRSGTCGQGPCRTLCMHRWPAGREPMRLIRRAQPASNLPATKPHIATASTVALHCDLRAEQH
jgi:hypothetical protein